MIVSEKVRAVQKKAQLARLKAKEKDIKNYPAYFANLPLQKIAQAANEKLRGARQVLKDANENLAIAEITGEDLAKSQENVAIAELVINKLEAAKNVRSAPGLSLAAGGTS